MPRVNPLVAKWDSFGRGLVERATHAKINDYSVIAIKPAAYVQHIRTHIGLMAEVSGPSFAKKQITPAVHRGLTDLGWEPPETNEDTPNYRILWSPDEEAEISGADIEDFADTIVRTLRDIFKIEDPFALDIENANSGAESIYELDLSEEDFDEFLTLLRQAHRLLSGRIGTITDIVRLANGRVDLLELASEHCASSLSGGPGVNERELNPFLHERDLTDDDDGGWIPRLQAVFAKAAVYARTLDSTAPRQNTESVNRGYL